MEQLQLKTPEVKPLLDAAEISPRLKRLELRRRERLRRLAEEEAEAEAEAETPGVEGGDAPAPELDFSDDENSRSAEFAVQGLLALLHGSAADGAGAALRADLAREALTSLSGLSELTGRRGTRRISIRAVVAAEDLSILRASIGGLEADAAQKMVAGRAL